MLGTTTGAARLFGLFKSVAVLFVVIVSIMSMVSASMAASDAYAVDGSFRAGDAAPPGFMDVARIDVFIPYIDEVYMFFGDDDVDDGDVDGYAGGVELPGASAVNDAVRARVLAAVGELATLGSVWGEHEIHVARFDLVSAVMHLAGFGKYMAHPAHWRVSVTADPTTGQVYSLADLFSDDTYIERISEQVARQIETREVPLLVPFEHIAPDQDFFVMDCALVVYYQVYELAPYAWGFPEFVVPFDSIEDIVSVHGAKICPRA